MAAPASITYVNVQGTFVDSTGSALRGRIIFTPQVDRMKDEQDNVSIMPTPVIAQLDANGHFVISLMVSDDAQVDPGGWTYRVREELKGKTAQIAGIEYSISITASMAPGPVYLADIDPTTPIVESSQTYVRSLNGNSGIVTLTLAGLGAGTSATKNVGTASNTVAAGDDSRIVNAVQNTGGSITGGVTITRNGSVALSVTPQATGGHGTLVTGTDNTARAYESKVAADSNERYVCYVDGKQEWGTGTGARDVNLYRGGTDILKTDDTFQIGASGTLTFGSSADVQLYRNGSGVLSTDQSLTVGSNFRHFGTGLGFYGAAAGTKPAITGSRGGNAALASLLTQLATLGLITDSTTA